MKAMLLMLLLMLLLPGGCARGPLYRAYNGSIGYSQTLLTPDTWEVSFNGHSSTAPSYATWLATVRAAELAAEHDRPFFRIENVNRHDLIRSRETSGSTQRHTYTDQKGREQSYTTYTPGSTITYTVPVSTLIVKLLNEPIEGSLSTAEILREAQAAQIPLSATSAQYLARSPPAPSTTQAN